MKKLSRLSSGEQQILDLIARNPDRLTVSDLARELESTPDSIKVMICRMRGKGCRITSPRHRSPSGVRKGVPQTYRIDA